MARVAKAAPDWGVIFFGYDWFAAYSAAAAANVAWDILIPHYKARLPSRIYFASPAMKGSLSAMLQCLLMPMLNAPLPDMASCRRVLQHL